MLSAVAQRDRAAFRALYDQTAPRMYAVALRLLGQAELAEDALQEAYITIWDKADRFDPDRGTAMAWITTIVRRRAVDRLRASPWLHREIPTEVEAGAFVEAFPDCLTLRHCLAQLDPKVMYAILLAYLYGMTQAELHQHTGLPLGTIKSRLRRGLIAIKECMAA